MSAPENPRIAVVGLGYVGIPVAVEFGRTRDILGFDTRERRISELSRRWDRTNQVSEDELIAAKGLRLSGNAADLKDCNVFIVAVPTPIDETNRPDFSALLMVSRTIGENMPKGSVVIYESTVYPGATEEVCAPALEASSGLKYNQDFYIGYSPERANPGDGAHGLKDIVKVTAGSTPEIADFVDALYKEIITAGTHKAPSIAVAEAAKLIENTQRDLNIALINELALIFNRLGIDTQDVLEAAGSKWNFLPFKPGLVGGHCIGVDPYWLTHKAQAIGYQPEVILAGRRINESMGAYVAGQVVKLMTRRKIQVVDSRVLVLGITFKENCPDVRNSGVIDIVRELESYNVGVDVHDPWADPLEVEREYGFRTVESPETGAYDAVILAVAHREFLSMSVDDYRKLCKPEAVYYDVKCALPRELATERL